jgi:hypothetical protein
MNAGSRVSIATTTKQAEANRSATCQVLALTARFVALFEAAPSAFEECLVWITMMKSAWGVDRNRHVDRSKVEPVNTTGSPVAC